MTRRILTVAALLAALLSTLTLAPASSLALLAHPVPAGTRATSVSFVSPQIGYVLGTASCPHAPCSAILRTGSRGASWSGWPAPRESVSMVGGRGLWGLDFADARTGFAYGDGLWATSDAAASWARITTPAAVVVDLVTVQDRWVLAITTSCVSEMGGCPRGAPEQLYRRALSGGPWTRIASADSLGGLSVNGPNVWLIAGDPGVRGVRLLASTDDGARFDAVSQPCADRGPEGYGAAAVAAAPIPLLLCLGSPGAGSAPKEIYRRSGSHWVLAGRPSMGGIGVLLAAAGNGNAIVAANSAADWIYLGTDRLRRWSNPLFVGDGGAGWGSLGFVTPQDGAVVEGPAIPGAHGSSFPGRLYLTGDGGRSWHRSPFS